MLLPGLNKVHKIRSIFLHRLSCLFNGVKKKEVLFLISQSTLYPMTKDFNEKCIYSKFVFYFKRHRKHLSVTFERPG